MRKSFVLSAAVLAASFSLSPLAHAADDARPPAEQQAGQVQGQVLQSTQQKGKEAAARQDNDAARKEGDNAARRDDNDKDSARGHHDADQMFARHAAADNQFEIQSGQYVAQEAQNPQVKELAQTMVQDHTQALQQLQQIAQAQNMQLSTELMPWQQAKLDALRQKHGEHLEREFVFGQVGDHHVCILMFQYEAEHGQNQQIKDYAQQSIPVLEKHLRLAEDASGQWVSQARTAGERIRGAGDRDRGHDSTGINSDVNGSINGTNGSKVGGATESPNRNGVNNSGVNR